MNTTERALYNIKRGPHGYAIGKFDADLNLLAAYNTDSRYCSCPAGPRPTCRHRKMLPRMLARVDTDEFYCYETNTWSRPLNGADVSFRAEPLPDLEDEARQPVVEDIAPSELELAEASGVDLHAGGAEPPPSPPPQAPPTQSIRRR